jgi:hypothetical protein
MSRMRTTLTLDEDVAVLLQRIRQARRATLKQVVNEALRQGLKQMAAPAPRGVPYRTRTVSLGRCLVGDLDDVSEVLAVAEVRISRDYRA